MSVAEVTAIAGGDGRESKVGEGRDLRSQFAQFYIGKIERYRLKLCKCVHQQKTQLRRKMLNGKYFEI